MSLDLDYISLARPVNTLYRNDHPRRAATARQAAPGDPIFRGKLEMQQNAKRVTPTMLARAKVRVHVDQCSIYSHERQSGGVSDPIRMVTFNATQTCDFRGNPRDHDNDK